MKYTIHGFSQEKAIQYGLDDGDLMVLRWFVDYKDGKGMIKKIVKGEVYYWVNYEKLAEAFPIRKWSKDTVYRRFTKMVKQKILSHKVIRQGGVWSYYNLGEKYSELIDDRKEESKPDDNKKEVGKESEGFGEKAQSKHKNTIVYINAYLDPDKEWCKEISGKRETNRIIYNEIDSDMVAEHIRQMDYYDFLATPYWQAISQYKKNRANYQCQLCSKQGKLRTHHKTYDRHGYEHKLEVIREDLIVLCDECHKKFHDIVD